ncbi:YigZ family protein [Rodentibacter caecimuris]|uniref:YigZ family protein n=2 Tax=Rodentibacter caecimuris TaxID=1796644 RepID=A0A9X8YX29_9PAST|nr:MULTISPECIES: YigZ family protein [Pasteurellaceae]AOF53289.1 protein co-occurring with transport systems [Pasteurellaceae bacterium NI1060]MCQ9123958.1 YigZ family protein [Rodentibacter heylii]MCR1838426.1 YigZ family protein [Pasteurella caecimuris]MCU0107718.1 YigZ family protein [Pasteurella caecimuris]OOF69258.1 YigZ family protein [Rodentibacter heylii]
MAEYFVPQSAVVFEEEIKKSRFITYLQHTNGLGEAKAFWTKIRHAHPHARHHCWAAVAGKPTDSQQLGFSDDGEPAGTAGKPMLSALLGSHIGEISAVVVRYYGGILLGTGGLVRAYGNGVQQALKQLKTEIKVERIPFQLDCDYGQMGLVQLLCDKYQIEILSQDFQVQVHLTLGISEKTVEPFSIELAEKSAGKLTVQPLKAGK